MAEEPDAAARWDLVKEIVADAFELEGEARARYLDERCAGDRELRAEVDSLLGEGTGASSRFLETPATEMFRVPTPELGTRIGGYELRRVIGEGGMGRVYEAVQERPHRTVALKVLRPGFLSGDAERRFRWEVEALGRLSHPGIAGVLEAGVERLGGGHEVSWFAMEMVEGRPLLEAADALALDRTGRLRLFLRVADAVAHAHQRGIIHRDLKPDNILVDGGGRPHVLDFGIARTADPLASAVTTAGEIVGTLAYMSPEQVLGEPDKVDAQSDVYALGVLLYRLLTGRAPLELEGLGLPKVALRLSQDDPVPAGEVDRSLRGDLETILTTALARDPERRYPTVDALAGDVKRWLAREPIAARAPTAWYQLSRFAARNRGLVAGLVLAFVTALGAAAVSWTLYVQADDARELAESEEQRAKDAAAAAEAARRRAEVDRDRAQDASTFMATILSSPQPGVAGRDVKVIDLLAGASAELRARGDLAPQVAALLHFTLGETYRRLGAQVEARGHLEAALEGLDGAAEDVLTAAEARAALAEVLLDLGDLEAADRAIEGVAAAAASLEDPPEWLVLRPLELRAGRAAAVGDVDAQVALSRELFAAWAERHPAGHDTVETARINLSNALMGAGSHREADALLGEGLAAMDGTELEGSEAYMTELANRAAAALYLGELGRADDISARVASAADDLWGPAHPKTLAVLNTRADVLGQLDRRDEGRDLYREVLDRSLVAFGPEHAETQIARNNLAVALLYMEEFEAAAEAVRPAVELYAGEQGSLNPISALQVRMTYANALDGMGREAEALPVYETIVGQLEELVGEAHPQTLISRNSLVVCLQELGRADEAVELGRRNLALAREAQPGARVNQFPFRSNLARALSRAGRHAEAEAELLAVERFLSDDPDTTPRERGRIDELLAKLYDDWGRPEEAARWRGRR